MGDSNSNITGPGYYAQYTLFWILGLLNNVGGVLVLSSAKSLTENANHPDLMGLITWANVALGLVAKILNTTALMKVPTWTKMSCIFWIMFISLISLAVGAKWCFWVAIGGILFLGVASALGESVLLEYFSSFHPQLVGSWSSGTGFAGIAGTSIFLVLHSMLELNNETVFGILIPFSIVYYTCFIILHWKYGPGNIHFVRYNNATGYGGGAYKVQSNSINNNNTTDDLSLDNANDNNDTFDTSIDLVSSPLLPQQRHTKTSPSPHSDISINDTTQIHINNNSNIINTDRSINTEKQDHDNDTTTTTTTTNIDDDITIGEQLTFSQRLRLVLPIVGPAALMLSAVYFFEYVVVYCYGSHSLPDSMKDHSWWTKNMYELLGFAYQVGVFFSRSSISLFHVLPAYIPLLVFAQGSNFIIWLMQALKHYANDVIVQLLAMVFTGLIAGCMYVNVFHNIQKDQRLYGDNKTIAMNIGSLAVNGGITLASFFQLFANQTFLKQ